MACSKIFSGDLPEITSFIIQYLRDELNSLHSCVLVNRFLCRITIPLLWENPFSIMLCKEYTCNFIQVYFLFLNEDDKATLKEKYGFDKVNSSYKPLFNYPSFIKTLNTDRVKLHVINWVNRIEDFPDLPSGKTCLPYPPLTLINHYDTVDLKKNLLNSKDIISFLCILLVKLFIKNDASLNIFDLIVDKDPNEYYFFEVHELILNNPKFISNIENFTLNSNILTFFHIQITTNHLQSFLSSLSSLLTSIKHFNIYFNDGHVLSPINLVNIIQSQTKLSSLTLAKNRSNIVSFFNAFEHCSNTLTSIKLFGCDFTNISSFDGLKYLTLLKSLQIICCLGLKTQVIQPLLDISTPLKIKSLTIIGNIENVSIELLFQKIGFYIEYLHLSFNFYNQMEKVLESVIKYCEKIQFLHLGNTEFMNLFKIFQLITHIKDHLKYLTIDHSYRSSSSSIIMRAESQNYLDDSSGILKELGQKLPNSLEYLDLELVIDPNDLQTFLDNCKQIKLKKLLIRNHSMVDLYDTLSVLKEFVKEKSLECLAYGIGYGMTFERHQSLEDLINETKSFVRMKRYVDLVVKISDFDELL